MKPCGMSCTERRCVSCKRCDGSRVPIASDHFRSSSLRRGVPGRLAMTHGQGDTRVCRGIQAYTRVYKGTQGYTGVYKGIKGYTMV